MLLPAEAGTPTGRPEGGKFGLESRLQPVERPINRLKPGLQPKPRGWGGRVGVPALAGWGLLPAESGTSTRTRRPQGPPAGGGDAVAAGAAEVHLQPAVGE